jgi:hypothetical protein
MNLPPRRRRCFILVLQPKGGTLTCFYLQQQTVHQWNLKTKQTDGSSTEKNSDFIVSFHCVLELFDLLKET